MKEAETVSETLEVHSVLTWLIARENFIVFSRRGTFKSYAEMFVFVNRTSFLHHKLSSGSSVYFRLKFVKKTYPMAFLLQDSPHFSCRSFAFNRYISWNEGSVLL